MSNRRKRRARESQLRQEEILHSRVRLDGVGEDPAVKAFLTKMPDANAAEAVELALALDKYLRGDQSVMANPKYADYINKMRARAAEIEDAERRWAEDPVKFYDDVWADAEKRIATGDKKARMEAMAAKMYQGAREKATAERETRKLRLDWLIEHGPKEDVECAGVMENVLVQGVPTPRMLPMVVRIMHRQWVLKPGMNQGVPTVFADQYRNIRRVMEEQEAREILLQQGLRSKDLENAMSRIDVQFGSKRAKEHVGQIMAADNAVIA